jgi:two-component system chemotaxis sensor kinase CheA
MQVYFEECEEQIAELERGLLAIECGESDAETVNAVFRAVHSIKGGAGAFGLEPLVRFAHVFETTLDGLRAGRLDPTPPLIKTMLRAADVLADLVRTARDGGTFDQDRSAQLSEELESFSGRAASGAGRTARPAAAPPSDDELIDFQPIQISLSSLLNDFSGANTPPKNIFVINFKPKPELYTKANETTLLFRELMRLGEIEVQCESSDLPLLDELDPEGSYLAWTIRLVATCSESAVREVFEFVEWDCDLTIVMEDRAEVAQHVAFAAQALDDERPSLSQSGASGHPAEPERPREAGTPKTEAAKTEPGSHTGPGQPTIRVEIERIDRLMDLVGELVINQSMLMQRVAEAGLARSSAVSMGLEELELLSREIQDTVMATRAQPVKPVFQRMARVVREVADMTGKSVRLVTEGEATEVDKTVIERLSDPLTHMIRNAIDHGLELPEVRLAAGKPEIGIVRLTAAHRSGRIVIGVSDDGAGIDRQRVRTIAIAKKLVDENAQLSNEEIDDLIFLPGFSTAATVSDLSGRGVGMDVVKRSIQALGGRISIASRPGVGSTFTMSLPLTLAVLDGMVVTIAGQTLVVPLTAIVETLQPKVAAVHGLGGDARVIAIRNTFTPLIDVGRELGYRDENADPLMSVAILVESEGRQRSALLVDAIQGQRQVVIKSLEANYQHVPGIAAATILGDGRVALILDVDAVIAGTRNDSHHSERFLAAAE